MYYLMYPNIFANNNYFHNNDFERNLPLMRFNSLYDAVQINQSYKIRSGLREMNWSVYKCTFFSKQRVSLSALYLMGLFSTNISEDSISIYYNWKS